MLSLLLVCSALFQAASDGPKPVLLRGVHVVDVEGGTVLRDRALLLEGGRIARIGAAGELALPAGATEVDGRGRYLIPGLCDMHVHFGPDDGGDEMLLLYLARGVTTVQCMGGGEYQLALRERVKSGAALGPRIFTCGPTTAELRVSSPEHARRVAREQKAAGYDAIKMYGDGSNTMTRATYHALVATAQEVGIRVVGHAARNLPFAVILEEGQDSVDHMEEIVYTDESLGRVLKPYVDLQFGRITLASRPELARVPDFAAELSAEVRALAQRVAARGTAITPTLMTFATIQASIDSSYERLLERPELCFAPPARRLDWTPERARFRHGAWEPNLALMAEVLRRSVELQLALTRAFHEAGVPLMTGTDSPFDFVVQGFALHEELAMFVRAGLRPVDALRASTLVPARFLGLAGEAGSIAPGKRADLVLLEADPLADIAATRRIAGVFLAGRWLPGAELEARIEDIARGFERDAPLVAAITDALQAGDVEAAVAAYTGAKDAGPALARSLERGINALGYRLLGEEKLAEAVGVFARNCALFPASANAWDSLGEAHWRRRAKDAAIEAYERSLELGNENARAVLEEIVASD